MSMANRGGKRHNNGLFGYMEGFQFRIGWRHYTLTKIERARFLNGLYEKERREQSKR